MAKSDDVIKWKHFPRNWPFVPGIHRSPVNSLHIGHCRGAFMFSLIFAPMNGWVNTSANGGQWPILLTWINFNRSMDKESHPLYNMGKITYPYLNFNFCTVDVKEWISNFIPHLTGSYGCLPMLGLKLNRVSKRCPSGHTADCPIESQDLLNLLQYIWYSTPGFRVFVFYFTLCRNSPWH